MKIKFLFLFFFCCSVKPQAQTNNSIPKGNLFIIGGGGHSIELIKRLIATAHLDKRDHIAILPMSTEEPDTAFYYIKEELGKVCSNTIANLNFTPDKVNDKVWLDSLKTARLIFITGGDQSRFMKVVLHTPVYTAIHYAYEKGSTISGTSAGAAVMSRYMITGNQLLGDTSYSATFNKLWDRNIEFSEGLGLITNAVIDQHFIVRSRYNRLLSALAAHPKLYCIGIDEATAIIVHGNKIVVTGPSQVVVMSKPEGLKTTAKGLIKFKKVQLSIYTKGDEFEIK